MKHQLLDSLSLERERGITIKLVPVRMDYTSPDGKKWVLNLIDTPGHVDFGYEVSRSLAACEGALLVVDATQGVEAQTVANAYQAIEQGLEILPVINKIDLPSAHPERAKQEIRDVVGLDADDAILASAKDGRGIDEILERIVGSVPAPRGDPDAPLQALIFDSVYDNYRGVICYVRIVNGTLKAGQDILFMATNVSYDSVGLAALEDEANAKLAAPMLRAGGGQSPRAVPTARAASIHSWSGGTNLIRPATFFSGTSSVPAPPRSATMTPKWSSAIALAPATPRRVPSRRSAALGIPPRWT